MVTAGPGASGLRRSLTLLRVFLLASAAILLAGALALETVVAHAVGRQALTDEKEDLARYTDAVLSPVLVRGDQVVVDVQTLGGLARAGRLPKDVLSVKIWRSDGTLVYTTLAPGRIGKVYPIEGHLEEVLRTGVAHGEVEGLEPTPGGKAEEKAEATLLRVDRVLEVYAPIKSARGETVGAYEVYLDAATVDHEVAAITRTVWFALVGVFVALYLALALLVRGASRRMRRQNDDLAEQAAELAGSFGRLERSSLEIVETLNATVEAKDPYTAGHSQRVRRLAVAIATELGYAEERLELIGTAALFHDVGKIGIPDEILTKPSRLTRAEFELMKEHSAKGAEIVSKLSDLADAVPIIRHHHERWDGAGYPDRLAGDDIPLEAAIVALADAWDAMTTERPYADARPLAEAFAEVREGRGSQFSPVVVDAFMAVAARRGERLVPSPPARPVAAA